MASGKVKWFDNKKGFGFIAQDSGQDVFVHHSSIVGTGFKTLNEGDEVSFDVVPSDKGLESPKRPARDSGVTPGLIRANPAKREIFVRQR